MTDKTPILARALSAGSADLRRHAGLLNQINVFPVMDGDTGVNLLATLDALPSSETDLSPLTPEGLSETVTKPLLRAARGNSGIILAEFLAGVFEEIREQGIFSMATFNGGIERGRDRAYRAVASPREGTMLTLMRVLAEDLRHAETPFSPADHTRLERTLLRAVLDTPAQLETLRDAGVVDSGALGFYLVAAGMTLALPALFDTNGAVREIENRLNGSGGAPLRDVSSRILPAYVIAAKAAGVPERYCVNLWVAASADDGLVRALSSLGASLNIARFENMTKIHIHTDTPDKVERVVEAVGDIVESEVQDMQEALVAKRDSASDTSLSWMPIRVAADSAISIHPETAAAQGICRINNFINVAGKMISDKDVDMVGLLREMREGAHFTTTQISPDEAIAFLDRVLSHTGKLLFIAVGKAYTGTQETVRRVVENHARREDIVVLDSVAASGQQGLVCLAVQRYAQYHDDFNDVVAYAEARIENCVEYLFIPELKYLKRSGRIGSVKAAFAAALSIKPIVGHGPEGAITHAKVKSGDAAVHEIIRRIQAHPGEGELLVMVEYTDNEAYARTLKETLHAALGAGIEIVLAPLSSSSSVHMGPGTWGIAVVRI